MRPKVHEKGHIRKRKFHPTELTGQRETQPEPPKDGVSPIALASPDDGMSGCAAADGDPPLARSSVPLVVVAGRIAFFVGRLRFCILLGVSLLFGHRAFATSFIR
jgi:hypothetical protein